MHSNQQQSDLTLEREITSISASLDAHRKVGVLGFLSLASVSLRPICCRKKFLLGGLGEGRTRFSKK